MSKFSRPASYKDYRIAVICALKVESNAVEAMFDHIWEDGPKYPKLEGDPNAYTPGRIGEHNVVLAYMPGIGKANAAMVAAAFRVSFPGIKLGLVVGICGGTPFIRESPRDPRDIDVFLGDIVISTEMVQYDLGCWYSSEFYQFSTIEDSLGRPNPDIRAFLHKMQGLTGLARLEGKIRGYLADISEREDFKKSKYQGVEKDILYKSDYLHKHRESVDCVCAQHEDKVCDQARDSLTCEELKCSTSGQPVLRNRGKKVEHDAADEANASNKGIKPPSPRVHFGKIASGDRVVKSAKHRNELADKKEVIGLEMEGAGAWDSMPIVVIKSVVDYADSHKSYLWQKYGAACGAACMKAFVNEWSPAATLELEGGPSAQSLPVRQTDEFSAWTREMSETRSRFENVSNDMKHNLDKAWDLLRDPDKSGANLKAAREKFLKVEAKKIYLDSSLLRRKYWGLMTVEKELSCYGKLETTAKIEHINNAQRYCVKAEKIVLQSCDASLCAQISLERHIIEGRKALLYFKVDKDMDKKNKLASETYLIPPSAKG